MRNPPVVSGWGGKAAHGGTKPASSGKSSLDCLSMYDRTDGRLLDVIEAIIRDRGTLCSFTSRGAVLHEPTLWQGHALWPCLQHPAVQCFLLWQLLAPGQLTARLASLQRPLPASGPGRRTQRRPAHECHVSAAYGSHVLGGGAAVRAAVVPRRGCRASRRGTGAGRARQLWGWAQRR